MTPWHPFHPGIRLHVAERISPEDAARQEATAKAILSRLAERPGLILADEVGMGKTFVALAVAVSVALSDNRRRPVVVMVPSSLKAKWPRDFGVFSEECVDASLRGRVRAASAETGVQLLKLLDDSREKRASLIFLTHGAMSRNLNDGWVKLAIIHRALHRRKDHRLRAAVSRCAASLVDLTSRIGRREELCPELLSTPPERWLEIMRKHGFEPEDGDDPVPEVVLDALRRFNPDKVYQALDEHIPRNQSSSYEERLRAARSVLRQALRELWRDTLTKLRFRLPLLILDEAHHLKNDETQLASLFRSADAAADAEEIRGALAGVFERMLFLTATPFQLGHSELCSVLERFDGIAWNSRQAPPSGREAFKEQVAELRSRLDAAQEAALSLDAQWGRLREEDLVVDGNSIADVEEWWARLPAALSQSAQSQQVLEAFRRTDTAMRQAERLLQPWVIRHLKPRRLPEPHAGRPRRVRVAGRAIRDDQGDESSPGLEIAGEAALPFLLAARATVCTPDARPVFAEGLASSYEAFLHTREGGAALLDGDTDSAGGAQDGETSRWYLDQLQRALPLDQPGASASHPKIAATAERVIEVWQRGEKVLVFCHFIQTGRTLRRVVSAKLRDAIFGDAARRLRCGQEEAEAALDRMGNRFFDTDSPARREADRLTLALLSARPALEPNQTILQDVVRRFLRTPAFLVRFFEIEREQIDEAAVAEAFERPDASGLTLARMLDNFFEYLDRRCTATEREPLLHAIDGTQTGDISAVTHDERQGETESALLANVRLVNGSTGPETRQRLMLTFNSPFFPEILIASSVMAEGVDLHRFCRYVIHHDLDWNPSTLEQRTGRVDRIGAKVEHCGEPIRVYLPYLAGTQDEKQFRVVMDRERWFSVVMGEQFKVDAQQAEKQANRVPLPASAAAQLAFRLEVETGKQSGV